MKPTPEEHWARLAGAARKSAKEAPVPPPPRAEIERRVASLQQTLRQLFLTWLWRRWSLVAILFAAAAYLAVHFLLKPEADPAPARPAISLPSPP